MLHAINYSGPGRSNAKKQDAIFVSNLTSTYQQTDGTQKYKIASKEQTELFGVSSNQSDLTQGNEDQGQRPGTHADHRNHG